jgi:hypothetical protein
MTRLSQLRTRPFPSRKPSQPALTAFFAAFLAACATAPAPAPARQPDPHGSGIANNKPAGAAQIDWSKRGEPAELARIIARLTQLTRDNPSDRQAWLKLAEAHCLMADGIAVLGWQGQGEPSAQLASAEAAALHGQANAEMLKERKPVLLDVINEEDGATLYWFVRSAYARAALAGYDTLVLDHALLRHAVHVAVVGAPSVDRGGPLRLVASLLAHPPDPSLRDLESAKQHLERALTIDPKNPANLIAYIEHYAVPAQDGAAVTEKLQQLAALTASSPEDVIALARAKQLASSVEGRLE